MHNMTFPVQKKNGDLVYGASINPGNEFEAVLIIISQFNEKEYLHIRKHFCREQHNPGDIEMWIPTKQGVSMDLVRSGEIQKIIHNALYSDDNSGVNEEEIAF